MNKHVADYIRSGLGRLSSDTRPNDFVIIDEHRKVPVWCFNGNTTSFYYSVMDDTSGADAIRVIATDNWSEERRKADKDNQRIFLYANYKHCPKAMAADIITFINTKYEILKRDTKTDVIYD